MRRDILTISLGLFALVAAAQTTPAWRNGPRETMCGLGTYHDGLDLAFRNAIGGSGRTSLIVEVIPSFQREYALILEDSGSEVRLLRAQFRTQLWTQLSPLQVSRTRQECLALASTAPLDRTALHLDAETGQQLLSALGNTRLSATDKCPRRGKECAVIEDGTAYVILSKGEPPVRITETAGLKGVRPENTALLDWIHSLLQAAKKLKPN